MAARRNRHTRRRNRGRFGFLYKLLSVLLIFTALLLGCLVFFRVDQVIVTGVSRYSEAEIIQAAGVQRGDNLYGLNKNRIVNQLLSQLPYIDEIAISRRPPDTLVIDIRESSIMAGLRSGGSYWLLDSRCKVLEQGSGALPEGRAEVLGLDVLEPAVGSKLKTEEEQADRLENLQSFLAAIRARGMTGSLTSFIDVSSATKLRFGYGAELMVVMPMNGDFTALTYQLKLALETMDERGLPRTGTLDLSISERQGNLQPKRWLPGDGTPESGEAEPASTPEQGEDG